MSDPKVTEAATDMPEDTQKDMRTARREKRAEDTRSINVIVDRFAKLDRWAKESVLDELKALAPH